MASEVLLLNIHYVSNSFGIMPIPLDLIYGQTFTPKTKSAKHHLLSFERTKRKEDQEKNKKRVLRSPQNPLLTISDSLLTLSE
jgi:hypothetical protein